MKAELIEQMLELIEDLPLDKQVEQLKRALRTIVEDSKKRSDYQTKNKKTKRWTRIKSLISGTTTHTNPEEKTEFEKAIDNFVEMRKKIKKPLTENWLQLVKNKLEKMYPWEQDKQIQVLNNSIYNSRQWIFPLKEEEQKPKPKYNPFEDLSDLPII